MADLLNKCAIFLILECKRSLFAKNFDRRTENRKKNFEIIGIVLLMIFDIKMKIGSE